MDITKQYVQKFLSESALTDAKEKLNEERKQKIKAAICSKKHEDVSIVANPEQTISQSNAVSAEETINEEKGSWKITKNDEIFSNCTTLLYGRNSGDFAEPLIFFAFDPYTEDAAWSFEAHREPFNMGKDSVIETSETFEELLEKAKEAFEFFLNEPFKIEDIPVEEFKQAAEEERERLLSIKRESIDQEPEDQIGVTDLDEEADNTHDVIVHFPAAVTLNLRLAGDNAEELKDRAMKYIETMTIEVGSEEPVEFVIHTDFGTANATLEELEPTSTIDPDDIIVRDI